MSDIIEIIATTLINKKLTIATAESCTGGLLSSKLTDISGSSKYTYLNFVTYSNDAKQKILRVRKDTLDTFGAVSEECAYEMAKGLAQVTNADICISTTGIAGPTGGSDDKPVGLMYSTIYTKTKSITYQINLPPNIPRKEMKEQFTLAVLSKLLEFIHHLN